MANNKKPYKGMAPILRAIISAYVLYIAYQLASGLIAGDIPENQRIFVLISIIVFTAASIWMFWVLYKETKAQKAEEARQQAEDALLEQQADGEDYVDADDDEGGNELPEAPQEDSGEEKSLE